MFTFQSRWKEELVCTAPEGSFVLTLTMGVLTAHLPTEEAWADKAPEWAKGLWPDLREELSAWCRTAGADLLIDADAWVD